MAVTRTFDILERYKKNFIKDDALCFKQNGQWIKYSSGEYIDFSMNFCHGLYELGLRKGDKIVTVSANRPEWNFADMGMAMIGVVHVPVFSSLNSSEYDYIIRDCDPKIILISDKKLYKSVSPAFASEGFSAKVYTFDQMEGIPNWMEIIEEGKVCSEITRNDTDKVKNSITPESFATLIYTSGTTGKPKGVMLSQGNLVSNFLSASEIFRLSPCDKYLSILPLCHVGGRMGNYQTQYSGASIYYAESMGSIAINLQEIKPHGFDAVPRVLEKFYDAIIQKGNKLKGIKKLIFFRAVKLGMRYKPFGENGWVYEKKLALADKLIFSKWRAALGGNVRIAGCGGASLQPRLERIFWAAGIRILNMYGLTETSPIITINRALEGGAKLGSVGLPIGGVELKIAHDGEILCKGPNVMLGYFKDPAFTQSVFDGDGWFHTGDVGYLDEGFLMVTDRKKEIFKLSNGKFIAPQLIENKFRESSAIDQIMIVGEHEKFASAIISPNFSYFDEWKSARHITGSDMEEMIVHPEFQAFFDSEISRVNRRLSPSERIKRFRLVPDEWSPATGELSPTLKLKRKFISDKYRKLLDQVYMK